MNGVFPGPVFETQVKFEWNSRQINVIAFNAKEHHQLGTDILVTDVSSMIAATMALSHNDLAPANWLKARHAPNARMKLRQRLRLGMWRWMWRWD